MPNTIQIPTHVLRGLIEAGEKFNAAEDALEDFLLVTNGGFIKKMRQLRAAHKAGRLGDWQKLKTRYGL